MLPRPDLLQVQGQALLAGGGGAQSDPGRGAGLDIFTNCSGCTATLSETYHLLQDEELRDQVNERLREIGREYRGTSRVRHIATLVRDEVGYDAVRESVVRPLEGLKVAIHYGCHLLKPSRSCRWTTPTTRR